MLEVGRGGSGIAVLVVGGGIAGMHASLILAEAGVKVYLVESAPACGGLFTFLDKTFPTHSCGVCHMAVSKQACCPMIEVSRHPLITVMTNSRVKSVQGQAGGFSVTIAQKGEYILGGVCDSCGECEKACPIEVDVPAFTGILPHKAIYRYGHRSLPGVFALDEGACTKCGKCVEVCPGNAINLNAQPRESVVSVSAIIASPGLGHYDPRARKEYGYDSTGDIITGLQLERLISPSGPTGGRVIRPSDCKTPKRIAFVQCVGSRDRAGEIPYCSTVCCMYAIKDAVRLKELIPDAVVKVFFMDVRACGKGFDEYYEKAKDLGVEFVPCRVSCVRQENGCVHIPVEQDGTVSVESFDLVVLSTGHTPPDGIDELSQALGINKGSFGYLDSGVAGSSPVTTERKGIYVCGGGVEPQDIPTAIIWSGACAFHALKDAQSGGAKGPCYAATLSQAEPISEFPGMPQPGILQTGNSSQDETEENDERIGVFVCKCGSSMNRLDLAGIIGWAKGQDYVSTVAEIQDLCTAPGIQALQAKILQDAVKKVVIAACSPGAISVILEERLSEIGIENGFLEFANIREQCLWAHADDISCTEKAKDLVAMAIEQVRHGRRLTEKTRPVPKGALVVGGGIAGMQAAKALAELGHGVQLVEKEPVLGGRARSMARTLPGVDVKTFVGELERQVRQDPRIEVHASSWISDIYRVDGGFKARIEHRDHGKEASRKDIQCGVVILATGGNQAEVPESMGYGVLAGVVTQTELETKLNEAGSILEDLLEDIRSVVMIQCVGSRDMKRPYCSRVCCLQALKNAILMKTLFPEVEVYVLHRDIRSPGFNEVFYEQARDTGVVFIRYPEDSSPRVLPGLDGMPKVVEVYDEGLGELLHIPADIVALSVGVEGSADSDLASALRIGGDPYGFYTEANLKVLPTDFLVPGVYVCGTARAPAPIRDAILSAETAAVRAAVRLEKGEERSKENISIVRTRLCRGCGVCIETCPYDARSLDEESCVAVVDEFICQGCGACQVTCPSGASRHLGFEAKRLLSALDVAFS